jgi:hypothetical protein
VRAAAFSAKEVCWTQFGIPSEKWCEKSACVRFTHQQLPGGPFQARSVTRGHLARLCFNQTAWRDFGRSAEELSEMERGKIRLGLMKEGVLGG